MSLSGEGLENFTAVLDHILHDREQLPENVSENILFFHIQAQVEESNVSKRLCKNKNTARYLDQNLEATHVLNALKFPGNPAGITCFRAYLEQAGTVHESSTGWIFQSLELSHKAIKNFL